ncbi:MAG: NAD(P)H-hydrate dehydratase [Acidobacteriota bacterium]|nr:NAD(P)H-hydrate dehydratase [Acidobacteriota bacterium]
MKVLTAAQMREVDRKTIELGIPSLILMENAGSRVVDVLVEKFSPLDAQRILVICGKGNNGGDGLVVARQLHTRFHPKSLHVLLAASPEELKGDPAENYRMLLGAGLSTSSEITPEMRSATIVVDALLGTGFRGPARGQYAELIQEMNTGFPQASVVAVDIPSGLESDSAATAGESVRAAYTVTFTAPKLCQVLSPACEACGELRLAPIGSPAALFEDDGEIFLSVNEPRMFAELFQPRVSDSNKGLYGHVLVIAGARGKTGAAAMAGTAALRSGAGLVTVASAESAISAIASYTPELMTQPLAETDAGSIGMRSWDSGGITEALHRKSVVAIGPGMGTLAETVRLINLMVTECELPMVVDADGLNALGQTAARAKHPRVFTPHPGEMARLTGLSIQQVQADRIGVARAFARQHGVALVLKGNRTVIAFPDGRVSINTTGSPALATAGTGDVLTGLIAGLMAQFPKQSDAAVLAAVYLHGRAGELGAAQLGEKSLIATDLFRFLPEAMREIQRLA